MRIILLLIAFQDSGTVLIDEAPRQVLRAFENAVTDHDWRRAAELYVAGVTRHGDKFVVTEGVCTPLTEHLEGIGSKLDENFLYAFRVEVQNTLRADYERVKQSGDVAAMESLVDRSFFATWGAELLDEIGNRHTEAGRHAAAYRAWWRLYAHYPNPSIERAVTVAKLARAAVATRDVEALGYFKRQSIGGDVVVDGKTIPIATYLAGLRIAEFVPAKREPLVDPVVRNGIGTRNQILRDVIPLHADRAHPEYAFEAAAGRVVDRTVVVIADGRQVVAIDPTRPHAVFWRHPAAGALPRRNLPGPAKAFASLSRVAPTIAGGRVYCAVTSANQANPGQDPYDGCQEIDCFDALTGRMHWATDGAELLASSFGTRNWAFTGAPVVAGDFVIAAVTTSPRIDVDTYLAAFDRATGKLRWTRWLASATALQGDNGCVRPAMTLAGGVVYVATGAGAIAAIESQSGRPHWLARYQRNKAFIRWETAPVVHGGLVYVLPQDATTLQRIDVHTGEQRQLKVMRNDGELRWQNMAGLVGAMGDWLVVAGNDSCVITLVDGKAPAGRAYLLPRSNALVCGRGCIDGETIYIPTSEDASGTLSVYHGLNSFKNLDQGRWRVAAEHGNLLVAGDALVVVTTREARVYTSVEALKREYGPRLLQSPPDPKAWLEFAELLELNGQRLEAAEAFASYCEAARGEPKAGALAASWLDLLTKDADDAVAMAPPNYRGAAAALRVAMRFSESIAPRLLEVLEKLLETTYIQGEKAALPKEIEALRARLTPEPAKPVEPPKPVDPPKPDEVPRAERRSFEPLWVGGGAACAFVLLGLMAAKR